MEKWEIRRPLPQKPVNRSSPKFAQVITAGTPTPMQKFHNDPITPFVPQMRENSNQMTRLVFWVLPTAYCQGPCTDFYDQYVK